MPRPRCRRNITHFPRAESFEPAGCSPAGSTALGADELEALRLADMEGLYLVAGASAMGISRATFGRLLGSARRKVAVALVLGMTLLLDRTAAGGPCGSCTCPSCRRVGSETSCPRRRGGTADRSRDSTVKEQRDEDCLSG